MKTKIALTFIAVLITVVTTGCRPSKAWNGQWKIDDAKSTIPGPTFVISLTKEGMYRLDSRSVAYNFACDGNKYLTSPNRYISCTQKNPTEIDSISTVNDSVVETGHWELSSDGKFLSLTLNFPQASGTAVKTNTNVYTRTSNSLGFLGGWKNTKPLGNRPRTLVLTLSGNTLHMAYPENGNYADIRLDGSDTPFHGKSVPLGTSIAIKPSGANEFLTQMKIQGRIINQGTMKLSSDGQTLIEEDWPPDNNSYKATLIYERQP